MNNMQSFPNVDARPESLRERKKRQAQAAIEEAALRLFQQKGYEQTSIQDIADAVTMSPRTFFRYYASKEEVLSGLIHTIQSDGIRTLMHVASTASPHTALREVFGYLAGRYQEQRSNLFIRHQIAMQTPSIASLFLYALLETEPAICEAVCSRLEPARDRNEMRFLVAVYMAALRVSLEEWLEDEESRDLVSLLYSHLDCFSTEPKRTDE
ncbi:TetR family transcriptional regulator [Paenibacillus chitinolyticus]|uniref:TetR family transcriptional regulator n=1 Tax=Paenibacillus chitinolyticus TaxID=79263 RepID=UPI00210AB4ED|nr:TetR family transcriptional regulator [Paenibacillus chitinolyticus]